MPTLNLNAPTSPDISRFWCSLTLSFPAHFWFLVSTRLASARALEESQNTCRVTRPTRRSRRLRALAASGADDMKTPQRHRPRILEPDQLLILQESYLRLFGARRSTFEGSWTWTGHRTRDESEDHALFRHSAFVRSGSAGYCSGLATAITNEHRRRPTKSGRPTSALTQTSTCIKGSALLWAPACLQTCTFCIFGCDFV